MSNSTEITEKLYSFPSELGISLPALVLTGADPKKHVFHERTHWYTEGTN